VKNGIYDFARKCKLVRPYPKKKVDHQSVCDPYLEFGDITDDGRQTISGERMSAGQMICGSWRTYQD
jgi:hypothetical protein